MIETLIDKQDTFEIVRDAVAAILTTEVANQKVLAVGEGKDPSLWDMLVYVERSNPWEQYLNVQTDQSPIVNVWYDTSNFDRSKGNVIERQAADAIINIDCIGLGIASANTEGHEPGDLKATINCQRAIRLSRNILMAAEYTYLGLRGTVWGRWIDSIEVYQPQLGQDAVQEITGARIRLAVAFNELSPQVVPETLESVVGAITRKSDGKVIVNAEYDYTA